jgi:hypothetical protein
LKASLKVGIHVINVCTTLDGYLVC